MIRADSVGVRVGGAELLAGVSLEVRPGELVALCGPNGAGKSTLLAVLAGDRRPSAGGVTIDGRALAGLRPIERAQKRAVLLQHTTVAFPFTAAEIVDMGRLAAGSRAAGLDVVARALAAVDLAGFEDRVYDTLSGGERQRVQLARVLAQIWDAEPAKPRYLLLDEPTSNLDLAHQGAVLQVVRGFVARGVGVLVVLHDLNLAARQADRIVILARGRLARAGAPVEALRPDVLADAYGVDVAVIQHPTAPGPLVLTDVAGGSR